MTQVTPYKDKKESKKAQVETMFDNIASSYDRLNHILSAGIDVLWRKKAIRFLSQYEPKVIMDMATGTGDFAFEAMRLKPEIIYAIDLSVNMLDIGQQKSVKKKTTDTIKFIKGDAENLDLESNTIDAITVGFGVRNFENLKTGLKEMNRVMKPGGHIAILELSKPRKFPIKQGFDFYFHNILPIIGKLLSKDNHAYNYLPNSVEAFPENEEFISIMQECGFTESKWTPLTFGICAMYTGSK
ncbi:MAG: bifunctional demethylmenaquinone methyltransferase/2-methoxy-6-polyprenyl-1,4-benzoquinol methylase UbiE [Chitinophagales bacterium]|nr:bifunctional demethylmenaquinone methyltransferase/2-methoxy-6-polyprenyl-1,4-benzoquinol methylase UbiE [Chitinophagales bacterium]